jgi:hypothetical protein
MEVHHHGTGQQLEAWLMKAPLNGEEAIRQVQYWDLLTRKLQVGVFIRTGRLPAETTSLTEELRERLEDLRDALLAGKVSEASAMLPIVEGAYRKCRAAYKSLDSVAAERAGS